MKEIWLSYKTYRRGYLYTDLEISNFGNVRGHWFKHKKFDESMIKIINGRRYLGSTHKIFHLVWNVFVGECKKGYVIHHKDFNKLNDRLDNLEMITISEHMTIHYNERLKNRNKLTSEGIILSEETRNKMSDSQKKRNQLSPTSVETRIKISNSMKGKKNGLGNKGPKGKHRYNNGEIEIYAYECPDGFIPGRLKSVINKIHQKTEGTE